MEKRILTVLLSFCIGLCLAQNYTDAQLIFDSNTKNDAVLSIKNHDSLFFEKKHTWISYQAFSFWIREKSVIAFRYNYEDSSAQPIDAIFTGTKKISLQDDFAGKSEFNYYFDKEVIGWRTVSDGTNQIIRTLNFKTNAKRETIFQVPKQFQELDPIIVSPDQIIYNRFILNSDNSIDTLQVRSDVFLPSNARVYMRRNSFMVDRYYGQQNPRLQSQNAIEFFKIVGNRLEGQAITAPGIKMSNYRIEANWENIWLLSHKIDPEKFLLFDVNAVKAYPFELDKTVFALKNLNVISVPWDELFPYDVKFSYLSSMNENNIFIYLIGNGIKVYRIANYQKLIK